MEATLALGFEPLPYNRGQGRQAGMQSRVTDCRLRSHDGPSKAAE